MSPRPVRHPHLEPMIAELFDLIKASGRTEMDVATEAGYSHVMFWHWRKHRRNPSLNAFRNCLQTLGYDLAIVKKEK